MSPLKQILIIDDDHGIQALLGDALHVSLNAEVVSAFTCQEGREQLSRNPLPFHAVVFDGNLPDGKGPDLYLEFRERLRAHGISVVIYSGNDSMEIKQAYPILVADQVEVLLKGSDDLDLAIARAWDHV